MERKLVLPGDKIADGNQRIPYAYFENGAMYATLIGFIDEGGRYMPIEKPYKPIRDDIIVGVVTDARHAGYSVDLGHSSGGFISSRFVRTKLQLGDIIIAKIRSVSETGGIMDLGDVKRLPQGKIVRFPTSKIPRLIGKKSSMLELIKKYGKGDIVVGNNGYVWISDRSDIPKIMKAMNIIDEKAHTSGLTDTITQFFEKGE